MGNDHHGHTGLGQFLHDLKYFSYHLRIQRRCWLIKKHHIRVHRQGTGNGDTLFLSTGKAVRIGICFIRQTDTSQKFFCFLRSFFCAHQSQSYRCQHNILLDGLMRKQVELLEYHTDLLTVTVDVYLRICDIHTFKKDLAAGRHFKKVQGTKEG